jgi:hypothetical protein
MLVKLLLQDRDTKTVTLAILGYCSRVRFKKIAVAFVGVLLQADHGHPPM